jgi:hypothetical protein
MTAPKKSPKLTANSRRKLKPSEFALPGKDPSVPGARGTYPIDTPGRARSALSRAAANATPAQKKTISRKVAAKYPGIKVAKSK